MLSGQAGSSAVRGADDPELRAREREHLIAEVKYQEQVCICVIVGVILPCTNCLAVSLHLSRCIAALALS